MRFWHGSVRDAWAKTPAFEDRVRAFATEFETGTDPAFVIQHLRMSFVSSGPTSLVLLYVDDDEIIVGHVVCLAEMWFGKPVVSIMQLQVDPGTRLTAEEWKVAEDAVVAFAKFHKAETIQIAARSRAAARLFRRRGFSGEWVLMKRAVEGRAAP